MNLYNIFYYNTITNGKNYAKVVAENFTDAVSAFESRYNEKQVLEIKLLDEGVLFLPENKTPA